jgi:flagellar assembly protein FliH
MRNYTRFIPGEEIEVVEQWRFGAIDTAAQILAAQAKARAVEQQFVQQEAMREDGFQAGFLAGVAQGRALAEAEQQQKMADFLATQANDSAQHLVQLFDSAQSQLAQAQQTMAQGVLELSCELARQVLRQELSVNPNVLMPVIREALDLLGTEHRSAVVRMNPLDMDMLAGSLSSEFSGLALSLRSDPALQPGGCIVESAGMVVDASLQKRWQRAVATLGLANAWEETREPHD